MAVIWIEVGVYRFLVEESRPKQRFGAILPSPNGTTYIGIVMAHISGSFQDVEDPFSSGPYATIDEAKTAIEEKVGLI